MIRITARGRTQKFRGVDQVGETERAYSVALRQWVSVGDLLGQLAASGSAWEIDFSKADPIEALVWGRHDLGARAARAVIAGRPVFFEGRQYSSLEELGVLEDAIVGSGRMVRVDLDDESGVHIGTYGPEPAKN